MVVACVAGVGASAAFEQMVEGAPTYAAELFGSATELTYPGPAPMVHLTLKDKEQVEDANFKIEAESKAMVTFSFKGGTFMETILPGALTCMSSPDSFAADDDPADEEDCGTVTIDEGGAKGDSSVTFGVMVGDAEIEIAPMTPDDESTELDESLVAQMRLSLTVPGLMATGKVTVSSMIATTAGNIPPMVKACPKGEAEAGCNQVVMTKAATESGSGGGDEKLVIDLDNFAMLAPMHGKATESVTIATYKLATDTAGKHDADGSEITVSDLAATMTVTVSGDLNEGDQVMIAGNDPQTLTVGADGSVSSHVKGVTGDKGVMVKYAPGKAEMSHGAEITTTFSPGFANASYAAIKAASETATLKLAGIHKEVKAYALPGTANNRGDKANVRVRCESGVGKADSCQVFLECWDDMGMGDIGSVGMVAEGMVEHLNAEDIEMYSGAAASGRLSCRVLATGMVSVQVLTRSGEVLVNNTAVSTNSQTN